MYPLIACVASVSNRVIARTLERKQKKVPSFPSPSPVINFFLLLSCPSFLDEPREETLATQANPLTETCDYRHVSATVLRVYVKFPFTDS